MKSSYYQSLKPVILNFFNISNDAIHIHIGFGCLALILIFSHRKISSPLVLVPGFFLSCMMEVLDLWDGYRFGEAFKFAESLHDILNTNLIPFVIVLLAKFKKSNFAI